MLFDIIASKYVITDDGRLYVEYVPSNTEIQHLLLNGNTYDIINNSVDQTISYYKDFVRTEMFSLLPENVKSIYSNTQYKINNSIDDPSNLNYDIFGFHKYEYIEMLDPLRKGELYQTDYYRNLSGDPNNIGNYSDLVLSEFRVYTRDINTALVVSRAQTTVWYLTDNTTGITKTIQKFYQMKDSIQEGIERRDNITSYAKLYMLSQIGLANGQILITELTPYITTYLQGNHQPLIDAVNNSNDSFLTPTIKATVTSILTF